MNWNSPSSVQLVVRDLNEIAADAYRHRIRSTMKKGGNGVYDRSKGGREYTLPPRYTLNTRARFELTTVHADFISLRAVSLTDPSCFISVIVDSRGSLCSLILPDREVRRDDRQPAQFGAAFHKPQSTVKQPLVFSDEQ
ncbi:MAG: hypothetical protein HBSIN02_03660 [Bacteroidia bacterium]|nr:MAG: hypothetical protein HBSIN02_03660 [Bacteroidia bacterium]